MTWDYTEAIRARFGTRNQTEFSLDYGLSRSMLNQVLKGRLLPGDEFAADVAVALELGADETARLQRLLEANRAQRDAAMMEARAKLRARRESAITPPWLLGRAAA